MNDRNAVHAMVDLETMSASHNAAIVSIGAVIFTVKDGIFDEFYTTISLASSVGAGLEMSPQTVLWWMEQDDAARKEVYAPLTNSMGAGLRALSDKLAYHKDIRLWGNGATFDNVILRNAYNKAGISAPWSYRHDRCYRTVRSMLDPEGTLKPENNAKHNALADAECQALHLIAMLRGQT
jgi:hypothetical protein